MDNCLVTKLKGIVNNDKLPIFGKIRFFYDFTISENPPAMDFQFSFNLAPANQSIKVTLISGKFVDTNESEKIISPSAPSGYGSEYKWVRTQNKVTFIIDTVDINVFRLGTGVSYCVGYDSPILPYIIDKITLERFSINNLITNYTKDSIDVFGSNDKYNNITQIDLRQNIHTDLFIGNIENLGKLTSLSTLILTNNSINGDINVLAQKQVQNLRTSGTLHITSSEYTTNNGILIGNDVVKIITFNSSLPNGYSITDPS